MLGLLKNATLKIRPGCRYGSKLSEWHRTSPFPIYDPWFSLSTRGPHPRTKSGGRFTISLLPGVGMGVEILQHVVDVFECCGAPAVFEWSLPDENIENLALSVKRNGIGIKGNLEERKARNFAGTSKVSKNVYFRKLLDLYINVIEFKNFPSLRSLVKSNEDMDVVLIRGLNEGDYVMREHKPLPDVVEVLKVTTSYNAERLADFTFKYAVQNGRTKVVVIADREMSPLSHNLFIESVKKVGKNYRNLKISLLNDSAVIQNLMRNPSSYQVILCYGLNGSMITSLLHGIIGSDQVGTLAEYGDRYVLHVPGGRSRAMSLVGKNIANPIPHLLAGVSALKSLGVHESANFIYTSIDEALANGVLTKDLGGKATTTEFIRELIEHIKYKTPNIQCKHDYTT